MTDLSQVLPDFPVAQYARLLPAVERSRLTVTDLLTLEVPDIGKRTQLPLLDIKRLCNAVLAALHADLGVGAADEAPQQRDREGEGEGGSSLLRRTGAELLARPWRTISTLDASLDAALDGGVPTGYITEITGESGAGKTQFLLTLLLAVQLPPPHGLGRPALYISTEAALSTKRLSQILAQHPFLRALDDTDADADTDAAAGKGTKPSLDRVISTVTPDLESQDHILTYQVPVEVARRNVGLIVLDSVAANYRAEFARDGRGSNMAARGAELARLGHLLQDLARRHDLAVVVANQVGDRFTGSANPLPLASYHPSPSLSLPLSLPYSPAVKHSSGGGGTSSATPGPRYQRHHHQMSEALLLSQESPLASRSRYLMMNSGGKGSSSGSTTTTTADADADVAVRSSMPEPPPEDFAPAAPAALSLDHQQRWFTGWGDDPYPHLHHHETLKTPSLGLVWSNQIAARIALFRRPAYGRKVVVGDDEHDVNDGAQRRMTTTGEEAAAAETYVRSWRRWMKVVFAPHVPGTGPGLDGAVEFEVLAGGLRGVERAKTNKNKKLKGVAEGGDD